MSWKEQYKRMLRSFERIQSVDSSNPSNLYVDDLVHFFMDCWHLKDWIDHDSRSLPRRKRDSIVDAAHRSGQLQTCAALANRAKHVTLKRENRRKNMRQQKNKRTRPGDRLTGSITVVVLEKPSAETDTVLMISYYVTNNRRKTKVPALDVAQQAVSRWKEIITSHGLRLPQPESIKFVLTHSS